MKQDESKTTKAAEKQPENPQPVDTAQGHADTDSKPRDGEGCEAVTVVIVENATRHALLSAASVKKYLMGVDAMVVRLAVNKGQTLVEALSRLVGEMVSTERIILMTDQMVLLNPVTINDIGMVKADKQAGILNFDTRMPVLVHRSALQALLQEAVDGDMPHIDIVDTYFRRTLPESYRPMLLGDWKTDPWLLPVVSKNPRIERVRAFAEWKKFAVISGQSWTDGLVKFLEERFKE